MEPPSPSLCLSNSPTTEEEEEDDDEEFYGGLNPISTPLVGPGSREHQDQEDNQQCSPNPIVALLVAAVRKSLVTCSVERGEDEKEEEDDKATPLSPSSSSVEIGWPTDVEHVSHVTFDRFNGFLGLPLEFQPDLPTRVPSASASVFGVSAKSMQCTYDQRGNCVPIILLMMQMRLYATGGLQAEGVFRINAENSQEEYVRSQLNKGVVPREIDVYCLAGLIKAWFRELPTGVLDSLTPEQVVRCNKEDEYIELVMLLPPMEAALLDWAINLMADVVQHERHNKMNARNIAMVFAPNMTQMADPLTALIHAVQVMNFLKTLVLKTLRERGELAAEPRLLLQLNSSTDSSNHRHLDPTRGISGDLNTDGPHLKRGL